jgi:uncharacterized protein
VIPALVTFHYSLTLPHALALFIVAVLAGGMNSMAGAGSLLAFPMVIFVGVPPIPANATTGVGLWPGSWASLGGYRKRLPRTPRLLTPLIAASLLGGIFGAVLLLHTPSRTFMRLVPYLFLGATLLFVYQRSIGRSAAGPAPTARRLGWASIAAVSLGQFAIATYGGFFGGGQGILMLALLSTTRMGDIHVMNSVRVLLASVIRSLAVVTFIVAKVVVWPVALLLIAGAALGGYGGARFAQKIRPSYVQAFVVVVGFSMAAYFFWRH